MMVHQIDPILDPRWAELVREHPQASVFHSPAWLQTLKSTYGYKPLAFTTSSVGPLSNGLVFCRIESWLTGSRLVSLPFSDHCDPLCDPKEDLMFLVRYLQTSMEHQNLHYMEMRPLNGSFGQATETNGFRHAGTYYLHVLDLRSEAEKLFGSFDKDSVQRRIQRAARAGLVEKCGRSDDLLKDFYSLFVKTRNRHGLPPSPFRWFRNLVRYSGPAVEIRAAYQEKTPVAAILTLRWKETAYYKYGCSDAGFHMLGAMPWLLWNAIASAKSSGATRFDFGRTEGDNAGLLAFKNHWVAEPAQLLYWRFPENSPDSHGGWRLHLAKRVFSAMPDRVRTVAGSLIYRHIG